MVVVCAHEKRSLLESRIAEMVGPQRFAVWFKNVADFEFTDGFLRVSVANHFVGDWIERHFSDVILEAARQVTDQNFDLSFAIDASLAGKLGKKQPDRQVDYVATNPERVARQQKRTGTPAKRPALRFHIDQFVAGSSNRVAYSAALSVIENPCGSYNPLFIHGGCGLGKTHLLQAICNGIAQAHPALTCRYVTGDEFTNDYIFAIRAHQYDAFRHRYRNVDVLVIDDVHFFANKRATQEEFLNTFSDIAAQGNQVVLSSDVQPKMIGHLSERLVSRLLAGVVVRIDSPDLELRKSVLRQNARKLKIVVPEPVIQHIAENFLANVRELEGALLKIVALAEITNRPLTLELAQRAVAELVRSTAPVIRLYDIESVVAIFFGLTPADLHTSRKAKTIALARGLAMYLARKHTDMSFPEIGRFMGKKNHSTVLLAARRISQKLQRDETVSWTTPDGEKRMNLAVLVQDIEDQLGNTGPTRPS